MSRQDNQSRGKASGRGSNNQRNRSSARGNAPVKSEFKSKKTSRQADPATKPKLRFDKNGKEIGRREKPVKEVKRSNPEDGIRLNKYIANSGVCSRREADTFIATGLVSVNGKIVNEMGYKVQLTDDVRFDGRRLNPEPNTFVLLNKPKGFATTDSNSKGMTVMDLVANATTAKIKPFGRLGRNATGLLLFTNDDEFVQKFTKKGIPRLFHIELDKNLKAEHLKKIKDGMTVDGKEISVDEISYVDNAPKSEVGLKIKHTGNSVIRTIFEHLGYDVVRVDCVTLGPLTKKDLPRGRWRTLTDKELNMFSML
ncbi:rRNA pseudouridine synthase [Aequorivita sp. F47161]|uniref:rRNA pseudouridine synthase n=1 Tax=Aequorivita vitellina TaxID=2874475 RepID=A0A9X1U2I4_9FLAO|nr:S4 domain-containing protein [Aequorivita vitellina]MCG2418593.1 rRNA pseudouridine synthase [Aequorivita vitellina]MCZ4319264.1 S4 domain-containing protein [Aequorivita viscosa]